jgi:hypothetical protein
MREGAIVDGAVTATLLACAILFSPAVTSSGDMRVNEFAPRITDREPQPGPTLLDELRARGRFTPTVRTETYDDRLAPHPLIEEAVAVLTEELRPYARGVYVTSLARAPEDQMRLKSERRYRYWTTDRSKHLLGGFAADIGFVRRKTNMWKLRAIAERALVEKLGEEKAKKLRVVRESRCIHVEIDTVHGREDIERRVDALFRWKMIRDKPVGPNPVPSLEDYIPERTWMTVPRNTLVALPS